MERNFHLIEINELAQSAINLIAPVISLAATEAAGHVADGFLNEPGAKLYNWLTSHFRGKPAAETLARAIADPKSSRRLDALRLEIEELAESDDTFRQQLEQLINAKTEIVNSSQLANPVGDRNKLAQAMGTNLNIKIE